VAGSGCVLTSQYFDGVGLDEGSSQHEQPEALPERVGLAGKHETASKMDASSAFYAENPFGLFIPEIGASSTSNAEEGVGGGEAAVRSTHGLDDPAPPRMDPSDPGDSDTAGSLDDIFFRGIE
jgi:hypothetical protein